MHGPNRPVQELHNKAFYRGARVYRINCVSLYWEPVSYRIFGLGDLWLGDGKARESIVKFPLL